MKNLGPLFIYTTLRDRLSVIPKQANTADAYDIVQHILNETTYIALIDRFEFPLRSQLKGR